MGLKVVLFGAGDAGIRVAYALNQEFSIVAFVDNHTQKQGTYFLSKPVYAPTELSNLAFDKVIISTSQGTAVRKQLVDELGIPESKILDYFQNMVFDVRLVALKMAADELNQKGIRGSVAELGVHRGMFAREISAVFPDRTFYLFDTFEGFPKEDVLYDLRHGHSDASVGEFCDTTLESVLNVIPYGHQCVIRKGRFPETSVGLEDEFAFVSLDVDLYLPIYEGLRYFYPRLVHGGYIFVHDYNSTRFRGVKDAVHKFCAEESISYVPIPDLCGTVVLTK